MSEETDNKHQPILTKEKLEQFLDFVWNEEPKKSLWWYNSGWIDAPRDSHRTGKDGKMESDP